MSALARNIEDTRPLNVTQSTQGSLKRKAYSRLSALIAGRDACAISIYTSLRHAFLLGF
jgi:hypothetical protein